MSLIHAAWNIHKKQLLAKAKKNKALATAYLWQTLVLIVTNKCNFFCKHCMRDLRDARQLPLELAKKAVDGAQAFNFKGVALTGGEPFLYTDLEPLIRYTISKKIRFSLVTNGWLFKKHADFLASCRASIAFIGFSVESSNEKAHDAMRRDGSFARLREAFGLCRKNKIPFRIVNAVSTRNYEEILEIGLLAKKEGAMQIVFTTMLPCPRTEENRLVLDAAKRQELYVMLRGLQKIIKLPVNIGADIRTYNNIRMCAPLGMLEVAVDVDGNFVQCCELAGYDSARIATDAVAVSLKDLSFKEALKQYSEYMHRMTCKRIDDFLEQQDPDHIDFNSCFYCVHKLGR